MQNAEPSNMVVTVTDCSHDSRAWPIVLVDWPVQWSMNELFPAPVMPKTGIKMSSMLIFVSDHCRRRSDVGSGSGAYLTVLPKGREEDMFGAAT